MSPVIERYESVPATYHLVEGPIGSMQAGPGLPQEVVKIDRVIPLWELEVAGVQLKPARPVGIRLRFEEGVFHAENDALSVYGTGPTPEDAIQDFKETASAFATEYVGLAEDEVIGLGAKIRANFLSVFPR